MPSGDDYLVDNIYYNLTPVPEPTTVGMLGIGLATMLAQRVRRNRSVAAR
jgi:hypothetical protein